LTLTQRQGLPCVQHRCPATANRPIASTSSRR
jgi:hypothetical protein